MSAIAQPSFDDVLTAATEAVAKAERLGVPMSLASIEVHEEWLDEAERWTADSLNGRVALARVRHAIAGQRLARFEADVAVAIANAVPARNLGGA